MRCDGCSAPVVLDEVRCPYCGLPYPERDEWVREVPVLQPIPVVPSSAPPDRYWSPWYLDWYQQREWNVPGCTSSVWVVTTDSSGSAYTANSLVYP